MAFGVQIKNTSGDLIVSSDIKSYHYVGSPSYTGVQSSYDNYSGSRVYRYTLTNSETPLIFIKPADTNKFYAVLTHFKSGNNWTYDVIGSGTSNQPPTLYAFSALSGSSSSSEHGILVKDSSGNRTFDSRDKPLAIVDIVSAIPPDVAADGGITSTSAVDPGWHECTVSNYRSAMEHDFTSEDTHNDYSYSNSGHNSNYMFAAPSIAQAAYRKNAYHESCSGCGEWWEANKYMYFWGDLGVFYRQAYKLTSSQVQAGWCSVKEYWWGKAQKTSWAPWTSQCDGSGSFGIPFSQKSINRVSNSVIIADATNYV
jgi:hypothetical protein